MGEGNKGRCRPTTPASPEAEAAAGRRHNQLQQTVRFIAKRPAGLHEHPAYERMGTCRRRRVAGRDDARDVTRRSRNFRKKIRPHRKVHEGRQLIERRLSQDPRRESRYDARRPRRAGAGHRIQEEIRSRHERRRTTVECCAQEAVQVGDTTAPARRTVSVALERSPRQRYKTRRGQLNDLTAMKCRKACSGVVGDATGML